MTWRVAAVAAASIALTAAGSTAASAAEAEDYLLDYTAAAGQIVPSNGYLGGFDGEICGFSWRAQAVIDADLPSYSVNGFLESISPLADPSLPGSGWVSIQHWYSSPTSDQLNWRIPIAIDDTLTSAQVTMVFDDPDWEPNQASFQQYSPWPGRASAFNRFMGDEIGLYAPHDDSLVTAFQWGTNSDGHTTLTFDLGNVQPGTSTVLQFTGTALDGASGIQSGTAYGAKLTLDAIQPTTDCVDATYGEQTVVVGGSALIDAGALHTATSSAVVFPAGTTFSLAAGAPDGATIDAASGQISWPVPSTQSIGDVTIPVLVTYADGSTDTPSALVHITPVPTVDPVEEQQVTPTVSQPGQTLAATGDRDAQWLPAIAAIGLLAVGTGVLALRRKTA